MTSEEAHTVRATPVRASKPTIVTISTSQLVTLVVQLEGQPTVRTPKDTATQVYRATSATCYAEPSQPRRAETVRSPPRCVTKLSDVG